jgi:hypothetical protein
MIWTGAASAVHTKLSPQFRAMRIKNCRKNCVCMAICRVPVPVQKNFTGPMARRVGISKVVIVCWRYITLQVSYKLLLFFTGAKTLCGSWRPPWFRNSKFFWDGVVSPTPNPQPGVPGTTLRLAHTLWPLWHGWSYQELTLPSALLSGSLGRANFLSTIRRQSSRRILQTKAKNIWRNFEGTKTWTIYLLCRIWGEYEEYLSPWIWLGVVGSSPTFRTFRVEE